MRAHLEALTGVGAVAGELAIGGPQPRAQLRPRNHSRTSLMRLAISVGGASATGLPPVRCRSVVWIVACGWPDRRAQAATRDESSLRIARTSRWLNSCSSY